MWKAFWPPEARSLVVVQLSSSNSILVVAVTTQSVRGNFINCYVHKMEWEILITTNLVCQRHFTFEQNMMEWNLILPKTEENVRDKLYTTFFLRCLPKYEW